MSLGPRPTRLRTSLVVAAAILLSAIGARGAVLFDPALKFRVLRTEHFRIYFHQGEDQLAARLSVIAENAWRALERPLGTRPPPLTHIVLADQTEQANGYATPLPYDTIVIYPTWPRGAEFDTDDWLRLVITHEFTHIVHLDRSESWARVVRGIFGRTPIAFPNLFLPTWQIEGLATFEESAITGEGRLHAGDFKVVVEEATRARALEPIDRVNGGLTDWPTGQGPYAYGVGFHQYLADRYGEETLAQLAEATARRVPYLSAPVFERIYGQPLGILWNEYEQSLLTATAQPAAAANAVTRLTHHGFVAGGPRFDSADGGIVYAKRTADAFPSLERIDPRGTTRTLTTRYFGSTAAPGATAVVFDQLEFHRNVALLSDLYALRRSDGRVTRLTDGDRLRDPDLSPDGRTIVAVREGMGRRALVTLSINPDATVTAAATTLVDDEQTQFDAPRWSPDGRRIAAERHRLGHDPEIVIIDAATHAVHTVAAAGHTRIVMPTWRRDGQAIVAAAAPDDEVFNLYEFPVDTAGSPRQLTNVPGGATWPDISADGRTIVFVGYTTDGYDVFSMPYPSGDVPARNLAPVRTGSSATASPSGPPANVTRYSPLPTLGPRSWSPVITGDSEQIRVGAETAGRDVLGYHGYALSATWLVTSPAGAPTPNRGSPDWFASYAYDRWRPTLFVSASSETSFFAGPATAAGTPSASTRRERQVQAGVLLPIVKARASHSMLASIFRAIDEYTLPERQFDRDRTAIRTGWRSNTARVYGYSISPEDGIAAGTTAEFVRRSLGASADATIVTADIRAYLPGAAAHHVVALRAAGAGSAGDPVVGRTFLLGGPGPDDSVLDFGGSAISVLRGFGADTFAGRHVALLNADYRWPIVRPQRGYGTWPLFVHTLHAAAFVDAGHAWGRTFDASAIKTSAGMEFSGTLVAGYYFPFTATVGAAWGHDGSGSVHDGAIVYVRLGKAF
jgi:hypothetical protein